MDREEQALWNRVVNVLHAKGASPTEALEGAMLILRAHRRMRREAAARGDTSGGTDDEAHVVT